MLIATLPPGTDGQVLVADSTQPLGIRWADLPASSSGTSSPNIGCHVARETDQVIPNNTGTPIAFDTVRWDTDGMVDLVNHPTRITIQTPGVYLVGGCDFFAAAGSYLTGAYRTLVLVKNGDPVNLEMGEQLMPTGSGNAEAEGVAIPWKFAAGDYIELWAYQGSGGNLSLLGSAKPNEGSEFFCQYLAAG